MIIAQATVFIVAVVLLISGGGKLRNPASLDEWHRLGVPAFLRRTFLIRLHPWGEVLLGVAFATVGKVLGLIVGLGALVLFGLYTLLLCRARGDEQRQCSCFGAPTPVNGSHLIRNVWLIGLTAVAVVGSYHAPLWGGVVMSPWVDWGVVAVGGLGAITTVVIAWAQWAQVATVSAPMASLVQDEEYYRVRTPAVPVTLADGTAKNLRELTATTALVLLYVSPYCRSCQEVLDRVDGYRALIPQVELRYLLAQAPHQTTLAQYEHPQSVHDPHRYVRDSLGDAWPTPTAVLFGADGMLAGGPVSGAKAIDRFMWDIYAELNSS